MYSPWTGREVFDSGHMVPGRPFFSLDIHLILEYIISDEQ